MEQLKRKAALGIFALLVIAAPLLIGSVDRHIQVGLVLVLGVGLMIYQPAIPRISLWEKRLLGIWLALIAVKEFAPWGWFGATKWRTLLTQSYQMTFLWTHNPEPGRVVDILLVMTIGILWFLWVRTLAADSDNRPVMFWSMLISAGTLAVVCLAYHPKVSYLIYGIYFSPGWTGYGPFPNRNHTACFLAMGVLLGCGMLVNSARHKKQFPAVASFVVILLCLLALLESKSRGGLIALVLGLGVYAALILARVRNRKALLIIAGAAVFLVVLSLAFGGKVISRFHASNEGDIPTNIRWEVWANTLLMWKDAPVFGHGLGSFTQVFPLYQDLKLENQMVLHPESSWLLWLSEMGILPLLIAAGVGALFLFKNVRDAFERKQGFFIRAGAFAAASVMIFHSAWDVPAHRWATAGFALAIVAFACPLSSRSEKKIILNGKVALVPFAIAIFWVLPYYASFPAWSPTYLTKIFTLDGVGRASEVQLEKELRYFSLSPQLYHTLGMHLLGEYKEPNAAFAYFRIADRLAPSSWPLPAEQARASRPFSAGMALHFWSLAIERAGHRGEELFLIACDDTRNMRGAASFWNNYVDSNPQLLLTYAQSVPEAEGKHYFLKWWDERGKSNDVAEFETNAFHVLLPKYGSPLILKEWISRHPEMEARDYKAWAQLLHAWKQNADAWKLLSKYNVEPKYPDGVITEKQQDLESKWFADSSDSLVAQTLARIYAGTGQIKQEHEVIIAAASLKDAPAWFLEKAAYLQAAEGDFDGAVRNMLRIK